MVIVKKVTGLAALLRRIRKTIITFRLAGPDYDFEVWSDRPFIYLDHWAVRRLSETHALGKRFLDAFEHRGTIMFSVMNAIEIARDASPRRAAEIHDFLGKLGPHWVPMTIDPIGIIEAEETGATPDGSHPCVSLGFLQDRKFARRLASGSVSLSHVVELTRGPDGDDLSRDTDCDTARLRKHLEKWRASYRRNPKVLDRRYPVVNFDPRKPMRGIYHGLVRYTIIDGFTLNDNHARDLYHALASVRCADMVTLDAHWAAQVRKLKLPPTFVRVYSEADFDKFLADLEAIPATR